MGKKDGEIKGELYFRRIIETSGENKEFDNFQFGEIKEVESFGFGVEYLAGSDGALLGGKSSRNRINAAMCCLSPIE